MLEISKEALLIIKSKKKHLSGPSEACNKTVDKIIAQNSI